MKKMTYVATVLIFAFVLCECGGSGGGGGNGTQTAKLRIKNSCGYTIWVQHTNDPNSINEVTQLTAGSYVDYTIPDAGRASDRFWAKKGCDSTGQNCTTGQSSNPCPTGGCQPPVDSKLEATWGCVLSDQSGCAVNPSDPSQKLGDTFFNASAVDGYTFPFTITLVSSVDTSTHPTCLAADCSALSLSQCPTAENLSVGLSGTYPQFASENLNVSNGVSGCYSPCKKLNYTANFGGEGQNEDTDPTQIYCCPTPPITVDQCRAGPVPNTQYVAAVHSMCNNGVYGYAYDDVTGLRQCPPDLKLELTFGPNCP